MQKNRNTGKLKYKDTDIKKSREAEMQRNRDSTNVLKYIDTDTLKNQGTEILWCRYTEKLDRLNQG